MSAILFLANGFEEIEAISVIDILRRAEIDIKTVGISDEYITGAHGIKIKCDIKDERFVFCDDIQVIIFPGGMPGTLNLQNSKLIKNVIKIALDKKIYIAAICAAPIILGQLGVLDGKKAICYPGFESQILKANIYDQPICVDEKFITAKGPGVAVNFALKIVEVLKGRDIVKNLEKELCI